MLINNHNNVKIYNPSIKVFKLRDKKVVNLHCDLFSINQAKFYRCVFFHINGSVFGLY